MELPLATSAQTLFTAPNQTQLTETLKSYSFSTGHPYVDALILAHVVSFLIGWSRSIMDFAQLVMGYIYLLITTKFQRMMREQVAHKLALRKDSMKMRIHINSKDVLFSAAFRCFFLKKHECEVADEKSADLLFEETHNDTQHRVPVPKKKSAWRRFFGLLKRILNFFVIDDDDTVEDPAQPGNVEVMEESFNLAKMLRDRKAKIERAGKRQHVAVAQDTFVEMKFDFQSVEALQFKSYRNMHETKQRVFYHTHNGTVIRVTCTFNMHPTYSAAKNDSNDNEKHPSGYISCVVKTLKYECDTVDKETACKEAVTDLFINVMDFSAHVVCVYRITYNCENWRGRIRNFFSEQQKLDFHGPTQFMKDVGDGLDPFEKYRSNLSSDLAKNYNSGNTIDQYAGQKIRMKFFEKMPISAMDDYSPYLSLNPDVNVDSTDEMADNEMVYMPPKDFLSQYSRWVKPVFTNPDGLGGVCFYDNNGIRIMLDFGRNSKIYFVSPGRQLTMADIQAEINYLLGRVLQFTVKENADAKKKEIYRDQMTIRKYGRSGWEGNYLRVRKFSTIYLDPAVEKRVREEFVDFLELKKVYEAYEVPYKKGILLHGPPGTGKTSIVTALAYHYQMDIYQIDVNDKNINDSTIVNVLNSIGGSKPKILLFEDIDSAFADKEKLANEDRGTTTTAETDEREKNTTASQDGFLTYSGLLQALDGVMSNQVGVITILTTNYIERLGDAFLRPGRIDAKIYMGPCTRPQLIQMVTKLITKRLTMSISRAPVPEYLKDAAKLAERVHEFADVVCDANGNSSVKPCELQNYIIQRIRHIEPIFADVHTLCAHN